MTQLALNLQDSRRLRDEGIESVAASNASFVERVVEDVIRPLAESGKLFTADHVRVLADHLGIPEPRHFNAWGAPMMTARRRGLIEATGVLVPSSRGVAHAHSNRAWRGKTAA